MRNATFPIMGRETILYLIFVLFAASIVANGYFAGTAKKNLLLVEHEKNTSDVLLEEKKILTTEMEAFTQMLGKKEEIKPQQATQTETPKQTLQLQENTAYFVKPVRVGEKVYPVYVDFEYYKFLKENQPRLFNTDALGHVFLPKSKALTDIVEMLKEDYEGERLAEVLLEFTHNVGYRIDPYNKTFFANNLTQYGIVTIVDGGDCLSLSVLLLNLYHIAGYDSILVQFRDHVVVGVATNSSGVGVIVEGKKYYIADPANFTQIGFLGQEYAGKSTTKVYRIVSSSSGFSAVAINEYEWV